MHVPLFPKFVKGPVFKLTLTWLKIFILHFQRNVNVLFLTTKEKHTCLNIVGFCPCKMKPGLSVDPALHKTNWFEFNPVQKTNNKSKTRSILQRVLKYSHGDAQSKSPSFLSYVLDTFQFRRRGLANFKVPTNYEMRLLPLLRRCQLAAYGNTFKAKSCFFKAGPIKGYENQPNLNCDHLAEPWNQQ